MGCFSGRLMSSASDQKLFCKLSSPFCSFDDFVEEKVISPSYSSAILTPPPKSSSNCCFLTCIQVSQDAGQVVWYFHLLQNFPQLIVIHTVKVYGIINKAEINVLCNSFAFLMIQWMLEI